MAKTAKIAKTTKAAKKTTKTAKPKKTVKTARKEKVTKTTKEKKTTSKKPAKKNIDWSNLSFSYIKTDKRYISLYKDNKWSKGKLISDDKILISECACVFQYSQSCFEGLKAYTTEDKRIVTFRPDLNAERMMTSCQRLEMPVYPKKDFIDAVLAVIKANKKWVPPYGSGATLYIRPYMFGSNAVIGVKPADEYQFRILVTPVGPYFKGGVKPITVRLSDLDRAAPHGTGDIKAGLNYAMSLHNIVDAHKNGFAENMYLDPATHTYIEETGGANILFITKDGKLVTPKSSSILPSITRRSIVQVAKDYLHIPVEERQIPKTELSSFVECGLCGTAAVISPIGTVVDHGKNIVFPDSSTKMGPVLQKIYDTLTGIQMGRIAAPAGWIYTIK
jgi:branched-chain amino acid aminotransferase